MCDRRELMRTGMKSMHGMLNKAVKEMTAEQLNFRPSEGGVSPFFSLWHYVRTEDNIVNYIAQGRPTVWLDGGYDVALGLHRTSQGTGMTEAQANAVQITDTAVWNEYQRKVWAATDDYLQRVDPTELEERTVVIKPTPDQTLWQALWSLGLTHGYRHIGEIEYARGVQGLGGLSI